MCACVCFVLLCVSRIDTYTAPVYRQDFSMELHDSVWNHVDKHYYFSELSTVTYSSGIDLDYDIYSDDEPVFSQSISAGFSR